MLHVFGLNARQTALRSISACESPLSTATCVATGLPTTHSALDTPGSPRMQGGGKAAERCGDNGRRDFGSSRRLRPARITRCQARTVPTYVVSRGSSPARVITTGDARVAVRTDVAA